MSSTDKGIATSTLHFFAGVADGAAHKKACQKKVGLADEYI